MKNDVKNVIESISHLPKHMYNRSRFHEVIKCELYRRFLHKHYIPKPEFKVKNPSNKSENGFIDLVVFDKNKVICAIEIENIYSKNSENKLSEIHSKNKIIIAHSQVGISTYMNYIKNIENDNIKLYSTKYNWLIK